jgi:hypothetical protein
MVRGGPRRRKPGWRTLRVEEAGEEIAQGRGASTARVGNTSAHWIRRKRERRPRV